MEQFRIGRTNAEPSYLRLKVETPDAGRDAAVASAAARAGCTPADTGDAALETVERDCCAPEDFYSTTNHRTLVRHRRQWIEVENQRMDAMIVVGGRARGVCRRLRDLKAGDRVVTGHARHSRGARIERARPAGVRLHEQRNFVGAAGGNRRAADGGADASRRARRGRRSSWWRDRWWCIRAERGRFRELIRGGWVQALLAGNALGVHDIEAALLGTSLGVRQSDGRQEEHGHRNHMRAINAIYHAGGIAKAVESGRLKSGVMYECVKAGVPFVLAGSLRDDGPLPDTITDMNRGAGRLCGAVEGRGAGAVPGLDAAFDRHGEHAAELGEDRVRGYQSGGGDQGERSRNGTGGGRGDRRRPVPRSACARIGIRNHETAIYR